VLLCADRDGGDVVETTDLLDRRLQGGPPMLRVDLGAVWMRCIRRPDDLACIRIAHEHLAGLRRRVDTGDKGHSCEATPKPGDEFRRTGMSVQL
jgi:hypothetical protein